MTAIEESMISVIIFSKGYASSRWCLEELVKIMECKKTRKQVVIPVFYRIDPSDVRNQTGTFGHGFASLLESFDEEKLKRLQMTEEQFKEKVQTWKNALADAANVSGQTSNTTSKNYDLAKKVTEDVFKILNFIFPSNNDEKLVGLELVIGQIESLLQTGLRNVHIIGLWGMPGIGKTTIAKNVFDKISHQFQASYFARNIREESTRPNGLTRMRQELLATILRCPISSTQKRVYRTNALVVLDDVTTLEQVESLIEHINGLGPGSRVIITSRDYHLLRNCGIDIANICKIKGLNYSDALQLFSWYAFHRNRPNIDYEDLSKRVVNYTGGVPLALKVLGCYLLDRSKDFWKSTLKKFEIIPHEDIHKVLKISYDDLNDEQQNIFLDIACFLKWETKAFVVDFLDACDYKTEMELIVLIDKCLISMTEDNKISMHDLLQEMGWEIVRQEFTENPGKRSRLWYHEDVCRVLEDNEVSNAVKGICLDMSKQEEIIYLEASALERMGQLRFFKLHNAHNEVNDINKLHVSEEFRNVRTKLRYARWDGCPLKSLQSNFLTKYLVALDMPHSSVEELCPGVKLCRLKHVNLSYSERLKSLDLLLVPNLENLTLEGCTSLCEIVSSTSGLNYKLRVLNMRQCRSFVSLPTSIRLESLEKVIFSGCSNLKKFPQIFWNMKELYLDETATGELPSSVENLSRLVILSLKHCSELEKLSIKIYMLKSLEYLDLSGCSKLHGLPPKLGDLGALRVLKAEGVTAREVPTSILKLHCLEELDLTRCDIQELPENLGQLTTLRTLRLGRNPFEIIPRSIIHLSKLSNLDLSYCERLRSLPWLPSSLENMDANNCTTLQLHSLSWVARASRQSLRINVSNCFHRESAVMFISPYAIKECFQRNTHRSCICFRGSEIPSWFLYKGVGSSITLDQLPNSRFVKLTHPIVCVVVEFPNYHNEGQGLAVGFEYLLTRENDIVDAFHGTLRGWERDTGPDYLDSDHVFMGYEFPFRSSVLPSGEDYIYRRITIRFYVENLNTEIEDFCRVKRCGVRWI